MIMKYTKTVGALGAATAMLAGYALAGTETAPTAPAPVAQSSLEGEIHVGYNTSYIWRGFDLGNDMVEAGVDMAYDFGNGLNISAGAWYASFDSNRTLSGGDDELDLYAEVSKDFGFATAFVGYIYYMNNPHSYAILNPFPDDDQQEVYFGLSRELFWGVEGSLAYYWDVVGDNGGYTELGLEKSFEFTPCLSLDTGVKTGYFWEEGGLGHVTAMVALNWNFLGDATISPYIAYSWELDELESVYVPGGLPLGNEENQIFGGVKLTVKF